MTSPIEELREIVEKGNFYPLKESGSRLLAFITSPEAQEELARAVRYRQFERNRRLSSYDPAVPLTDAELDNAAAVLDHLARKALGHR